MFPRVSENGYFRSFVFLVLVFLVCVFLVCLILCFSCREIVRAQNLGQYCAFSDAWVPVLGKQ